MRVSEYFGLGRTQPSLDFVDVDIEGDTRVFIDPRALRLLPSKWGDECVSLIQNFFKTILLAIRDGQNDRAKALLRVLREPNETHLGLSIGKARGRGLGYESAVDVWQALSESEAVRTGLLEDLEDTILLIEGISSDIISDMTTNIIRGPLIKYTQERANYYGIPVTEEIDSGPLWDPAHKEWYSELVSLPMTDSGKLLLVPKAIVRRRMEYDYDEYYRHYLLVYLSELELKANTELVRLLKDGRRKVHKKDLKEKYGSGKKVLIRETLKYPEILQRYRRDKRKQYRPPLDHYEISESEGSPSPDWDALIANVLAIPVGHAHFGDYEKAVESLLTALFYPFLTNPQVQLEIHEGRKRIDITYTNMGTHGFFGWLAQHYTAPHVFIECKNYGSELGNPELDQMAGRFSPSRGQFGIIVCRGFADKKLFTKRCRDTANDNRGFIIPLDDSDLIQLTRASKEDPDFYNFYLLKKRFDELVM